MKTALGCLRGFFVMFGPWKGRFFDLFCYCLMLFLSKTKFSGLCMFVLLLTFYNHLPLLQKDNFAVEEKVVAKFTACKTCTLLKI